VNGEGALIAVVGGDQSTVGCGEGDRRVGVVGPFLFVLCDNVNLRLDFS